MVLRQQLFNHVRPSANRLAGWLFDWQGITGEELPLQIRGASWSLALFLVGVVFWVLRRLSPMEWIAHALFDADVYDPETHKWRRGTPATYVDGYLLASYLFSLTLIDWLSPKAWWLPLVWIVQVLQVTLYNTFWHPAVRIVPTYRQAGGMSMDGGVATHQHIRQLLLALVALVEMTWLFAVVYYVHFGEHSLPTVLAKPSDAFYFSLSLTTLFGLGDRWQPNPDAYLLKYLMTTQVLCGLMMMLCVLSRGIAAVASAREPYGEPKE